jgi:hypothetical protein
VTRLRHAACSSIVIPSGAALIVVRPRIDRMIPLTVPIEGRRQKKTKMKPTKKIWTYSGGVRLPEKLEQARDQPAQDGGRQHEAEQQVRPETGPRDNDPHLSAGLLDLAAHERRPGGAITKVRGGLCLVGGGARLVRCDHDLVVGGGIHQREAQETGDETRLLAAGSVIGGAGERQIRPAPLALQRHRVAVRRVRIPFLETEKDAVVVG